MFKTIVFVSCLLGLIHSGVGQIISDGQCNPGVTGIANFNAANYLNRWFLIESYPSSFQTGDCIDATYTLNPNGTVDVFNTQVVNQLLETETGVAELPASDIGRLLVTFPNSTVQSEYLVLATDYTDYALVYSCANVTANTRAVFSWKLSRTQTLSANATTIINNFIAGNDYLNNTLYESVNHTSEACFYFPEPSNEPPRFRARCSPNVSPIENFNATGYLDLWHLIETYPSTFQTGTCQNAYYSLGNNSVDVLNSQVINQTLDTMIGNAVVAFNDGRGILNVSFPIAGSNETTNTPYWILATDYSSYALVYTCIELDDEYSQVWSWKLSRDRSLSATAEAAINNVTNNILVLDQRYYQQVNQSTEGCFYFPEAEAGVEVVFPGQCETDISVVQNFSLSSFEGLWYEVEAYPDLLYQGECKSRNYTAAADGLNVQASQVLNETFSTNTGTLRFTSLNDSSARLTLSKTVNGQVVQMPYWIIDTDYNNYALAYSCMNLTPDTKVVYSWKLSRNQSLTAASQTAINTAMASVTVIDNIYFRPVSQSDDACFYLPPVTPGLPVVFPGQCDSTIPVVQNFDAARYLGRWRMIESYATEYQRGECIEADYSLNTDGTVNVFNTQVYNLTREAINGTAVANTDGSGRLEVTFPGNVTTTNYWVLATDYDSYSLVYSCTNISTTERRVTAWKLSRDRTLSANASNVINPIIASINVLDARYFSSVAHSDDACFYYPEFDTLPGVITLPGTCNTTVAGVNNFNATAYLGRWIEIERYPQLFQSGECPRAEYSLGVGNVVDVFNTEVVNRTLLSQAGTAVVSSATGNGELLVTFNVSGFINVANYYILATDYDNYALVYSCRNISDTERQVFSWKLSRNTSLSNAANTAMNNVIASTQGLRQEYYLTTNQSDESCFYIPETLSSNGALFRGSCPNVVGQANFNIQNYLGWWHHINNYPSGEDTGTCLSTQYQQVGTQIEFVDTQVFGLTGQLTRGTVEASTNGRLNYTWNNGLNTRDVWVLATDYSSYSLVFSCEQFNDEYVRVWSSMQSKNRTLSAAAQQAIAAVVANNDYLISNFFLPVNQTDNACFHYPETTNRVILPGQCDQNIPTQASFDLAAYAGTWYQIERYPYPEVSGNSTCIGTRYTQISTGFNVVNWEVLDGELNSIEGEATVEDNSAVLVVTLPGANDQQSVARLHVLNTDYTSYAIAYTCENIGQFERAVVAFKLSRGRLLSANASSAINAFMDSREELHQPLFISVPQSEDCEEPSSSFLIRSSLIVVVICYAINMLM